MSENYYNLDRLYDSHLEAAYEERYTLEDNLDDLAELDEDEDEDFDDEDEDDEDEDWDEDEDDDLDFDDEDEEDEL